jgi:hypothetical protein
VRSGKLVAQIRHFGVIPIVKVIIFVSGIIFAIGYSKVSINSGVGKFGV